MNITDGKVIGDTISFVAGDTRYTGRVNGNAIEGISRTSTGWRGDALSASAFDLRPLPAQRAAVDGPLALRRRPRARSSPPMIDRFFVA